jgi:hypothetical protein
MKDYRYKYFHTKSSQRLADLEGLGRDLELVIETCDKFQELYQLPPKGDSVVIQSLFSFAVVTYVRTIKSDVRTGISKKTIDEMPKELQEFHKYFKDLRDQYVAHSVNNFEENEVKVYYLEDKEGVKKIHSVQTGSSRVVSISPNAMENLKRLAEYCYKYVEVEYDVERERILKEVLSIPNEAFENLPECISSAKSNVSKRRKLHNGG